MSQSQNSIPGPGDIPTQTQISDQWERPGLQDEMKIPPISSHLPNESESLNSNEMPPLAEYVAADKLKGKRALITGGDSGIGRAVAILFAKEGAHVAINYLAVEETDAVEVKLEIDKLGRKCVLVPGDITSEKSCKEIVKKTVDNLGGLDILVNNAAEQHIVESIEDITQSQIESTFKTNIFSMFYLTKFSLPHMSHGSKIINTTSVVAYRGSSSLLDYGATKGAIVSFTRCLAQNLASRGIRVNAVAPGPVYTPLQPISRDEENMKKFLNQSSNLTGRVAQPSEIATSYVFLASNDSSQFTGQVLHPNGGEIYNA